MIRGHSFLYPSLQAELLETLPQAANDTVDRVPADRRKAAEYLYNGMVTQKPSELHLNRYMVNPKDCDWARDLAKLLPADKAAAVLARLDRRARRKSESLLGWGEMKAGEFCINGGGAAVYDGWAGEIAMRRMEFNEATIESFDLPAGHQYSIGIARTPSGLWVQALKVEKSMCSPQPGMMSFGHDMVIYHSPTPGRWEAVDIPRDLQIVKGDGHSQTNILSGIAQVGSDVVLATWRDGLYVYDLTKASWRHLGVKEGLPTEYITAMVGAADGRSAWLAGGKFLYQYKDGGIFLSNIKTRAFFLQLISAGDCLFAIQDQSRAFVAIDPATGQIDMLEEQGGRRYMPVPQWFLPGEPWKVHGKRVLAYSDGTLFAIGSPHSFLRINPRGKTSRLWRSGMFFYWGELGVWVEGNCPLPPCRLKSIVTDDQRPGLLWLVSQTGYPDTDFRFPGLRFGKGTQSGETFIAAYDSRTNLFSKPLRVAQLVTGCEAWGDYLYLTGGAVSRMAKKQWVIDQPGEAADAPLRASCPDPRFAEASMALFRGEFDKVRQALDRLTESDLPASKVSAMRRSLNKLIEARSAAEVSPAPTNAANPPKP